MYCKMHIFIYTKNTLSWSLLYQSKYQYDKQKKNYCTDIIYSSKMCISFIIKILSVCKKMQHMYYTVYLLLSTYIFIVTIPPVDVFTVVWHLL